MAVRRKISIRKVLQVFLTLVVTTCCVIAMVSASRIEDSKTLKGVAIHFRNDKKYHSIQEQEIMDLAINNRHVDIQHTPLSRVDIHTMEHLIMADPWVAYAQVYVDNEHILHMYVTQRIPVVRVFQQDSKSFYLDTTTSIMPLSDNYIYYTTVVTNVPPLADDSTSKKLKKDILSVVRTIQEDTFWNAQISQVIVDSIGMFEFVPILGDHRILFGDATRIKEKLHNLFVFYRDVLDRIGWDKYQTLDVRFKGQVVASPSLPYSGPVDKEVNKMNWINSIVETEAKNDAKDSVQVTETKTAQAADNVKAKTDNKKDKPANAKGMTEKGKPLAAAGAKKDNKQKSASTGNQRKVSPKYIYPAKKGH